MLGLCSAVTDMCLQQEDDPDPRVSRNVGDPVWAGRRWHVRSLGPDPRLRRQCLANALSEACQRLVHGQAFRQDRMPRPRPLRSGTLPLAKRADRPCHRQSRRSGDASTMFISTSVDLGDLPININITFKRGLTATHYYLETTFPEDETPYNLHPWPCWRLDWQQNELATRLSKLAPLECLQRRRRCDLLDRVVLSAMKTGPHHASCASLAVRTSQAQPKHADRRTNVVGRSRK